MDKKFWKLCALASIGFALVLGSCNHGGGSSSDGGSDAPTSDSGSDTPISDSGSDTPTSSGGDLPDSSSNQPSSSSSHEQTGDMWDVTFDYNYETKFKTYLVEQVKDGTPVKKPEAPIRKGYDFVDWFHDPYCRLDRKWDFSRIITSDLTLYACWERNGDPIDVTEYTITYQPCLGASFVPNEGELKYIAEYGDVIQFKVEVDTEHYEGTPIVQANGDTLEAENGLYTYVVKENVQFTISGLSKISAGSYFLYYENASGWDDVYIYMWDSKSVGEDGVATNQNAAWPGERMTLDAKTGLMMYEIENPDEFTYDSLIFNGGENKGQTSDLSIVTSYPTGATLYYGDVNNTQEKAFDPKSTKSEITWKESADYAFVSLIGNALPTQVNQGDSVSFRVNILKSGFSGEITVMANQEVLVAKDGVYTFTANALLITVKVTGFIEEGTVDLFYTLPTWDPVATNPKIYYWGTDANGTGISNTIDWGSATDTQGSMTLISGNDYKMSIDMEEGMTISGIIVVMYQNGEKKQSQDIITSIVEAGSYQITFGTGDWVQNSLGEWVFPASIAKI